ncbi:MAG: ABC transporter ATP-binding protein [Chloroflexi bacterium]|nr:ABC transporter ATP-binding protein [Chloroflexota bacterium]OJV90061.1 MAG: ABC transporter ATP-binding protein [Chloroflexi bacterium 54-19]
MASVEDVKVGSVIRLKHISKIYRLGNLTVPALEDVSLEVSEGEFIVVLGPSGSGKTTLLNIIGALDLPTGGSLVVNGLTLTGDTRPDRFRYRREAVSFVFQTFNLFPGLTALENVQFALDVVNRNSKPSPVSAQEVLQMVGLGERLHNFPHQLSGGEQQRVAIARALATGNPVLLADEPTGELDFKTGVQILHLLHQQTHAGKTVLIVTHNREIARVADRVIELSSGRIISDSPPTRKAEIAELSW